MTYEEIIHLKKKGGNGDMKTSIYDPAGGAKQVAFADELITDHNSLSGLQGGTTSEYYHLTSAELTLLQGVPTNYLKLDQTTKQTLTTSPIFGNLTAGRVPFVNTDGSLTDDSGLFYNNTTKNLGLGTSTPAVKMTIQQADQAYAQVGTSATWDIALGIAANTSKISGMDFKNFNAAGQVRLMARNNQNDYLVMNTFGSTASGTLCGVAYPNCSGIFQQATTDTDKKFVITSFNAGEVIFGTNNKARVLMATTDPTNIKFISQTTTTGTVLELGLLMSTTQTLSATLGIRGIRQSSISGSDLALFTNSTNRLYINGSNGYIGLGKTSPIYPVDSFANITGTIGFFKGSGNGAIALDSNTSNAAIHTYNGSAYTPLILRAKAGDDGGIYLATDGKVGIGLTNGTKLLEVKGTAGYNSVSDMGANDNDFACKKYVDDIVNAAIKLQGDWDADSNDPDISSETETGYAWRVSVAGTTNLGGITDWSVGDLAIKTDTGWIKVGSGDINLNRGDILGDIENQTDLTSRIEDLASVYESKGVDNAVNVSDGAGKWKDSGFIIADFTPTSVKNSIERDISDSKVQLVGDIETPGNEKYYGTNDLGERGFHDLPVPTVQTKNSIQINEDGTIDLYGDSLTPGASKYYGTNSAGVKGFHSVSRDCIIKHHFLLGNSFSCSDMSGVAINSGTLGTVNNVPNHPGVTQIRASTSNDSGFYFRTGTASIPMSTGKHTGTFIIRPDSDALTSIARFGFQTGLTVSESGNSIWLNTVGDGAGNVIVSGKQRNVSTETTATSHTLVIGTWVTGRVVIDSVSNTITFTLHNDSGTQLRTDTLVLNSTVKANANFFGVVAVGRSSANIVSIDYFDYCIEGLTAYYG